MPAVKITHQRDLYPVINEFLAGCRVLLDLGAGTGENLAQLSVPVKLGVDIHRPYLEKWTTTETPTIPLHLSLRSLRQVFLPKTVDAVTFLDSLEHLLRRDALAVLADAQEVARRVVVVFTPRGYFPQAGFDAIGLGGEKYQKHRSTWEAEDFTRLGFDVLIFAGFHGCWNESFRRACGEDSPPSDALLAYKYLI